MHGLFLLRSEYGWLDEARKKGEMMKLLALTATLVLLNTCLAVEAVPLHYKITGIGTLGGHRSMAYGINNLGQVVGSSTAEGDQVTHAFLWQNGQITDLGVGEALAISDDGWIVGSVSPDNVAQYATIWHDGTMISLNTISTAYGVNNIGQVVGIDRISGHPFLWEDGTTVDVIPVGGYAFDINDDGTVVGCTESPTQAYVWNGGTTTNLPVLGSGNNSMARAVNDSGQVVGYSSVDANRPNDYLPVLWDNGVIRILGTGDDHRSARAINNKAQIVGVGLNTGPWIWQDGVMYLLSDLVSDASDWSSLGEVNAINDSGLIAGWGWKDGHSTAFILTPVPEPSSTLALLFGLGALGGLAQRKKR